MPRNILTNLPLAPSPTQAVQIFLDEDEESYVSVVDTPGFDDTNRTDGEILAEITEYLAAQYTLNIPLKGIIYLHRIYDNKMKGSARRYLETFRSLCGEHALKNVILVTTCWDSVRPENLGEALRREQELIDKYWAPMQEKGSYIAQFNGSKESAEALILELVHGRDSVVLEIQRELVDGHKEVAETEAGRKLKRQLEIDINAYRQRLAGVDAELGVASREGSIAKEKWLKGEKRETEKLIKQLERSQKRMQARVGTDMKDRVEKERKKRREILAAGVSVFAAVLSITLTVVKFVAF
jgi:hypothetical protein